MVPNGGKRYHHSASRHRPKALATKNRHRNTRRDHLGKKTAALKPRTTHLTQAGKMATSAVIRRSVTSNMHYKARQGLDRKLTQGTGCHHQKTPVTRDARPAKRRLLRKIRACNDNNVNNNSVASESMTLLYLSAPAVVVTAPFSRTEQGKNEPPLNTKLWLATE